MTSGVAGRRKTTRAATLLDVDQQPPPALDLEAVSLESELKRSFMSYAMSTILSRALPDVRDGLKPVHRRILYAMRELKLSPSAKHRKCARIVGEVLGKFHPHGDNSVYEALVRMAQDFVMSAPLVDGQGNFGSVDADPPAAMRYTECKPTKLSWECLLNKDDLGSRKDSDTYTHGGISVDLVLNFDEAEREPSVLPARYPNLLVNGASGIAVGMSTNVPPHNLGEVCSGALVVIDAARQRIQNRLNNNVEAAADANAAAGTTKVTGVTAPDDAAVEAALFKAIPGPDFPTGGTIMGRSGIASLYATGNGAMVVRAKTHTEQAAKGVGSRTLIVATELPYQVTKSDLVQKTYELVKDRKIEGIADLRDESGREGIRVVYELKRDAQPDVVLNALFKQTKLQNSIPGNVVAVDFDAATGARTPRRFSLRETIESWLAHRFQCVRERSGHNERRVGERLRVVDGLLLATGRIDEVVGLIRGADSPPEAKAALQQTIGLDSVQADAVLALRLSSLTKLERTDLQNEQKALAADLARLRDLLTNDGAVLDVIDAEVTAVKKDHGKPRRTVIDGQGEAALDVRDEDLIPNARSAILVGRNGYVKRIPLVEFSSQSRGGRGKTALSNDDRVERIITCHDRDTLLCFSDTGHAYGLRTFDIPESARTARGTALTKLMPNLEAPTTPQERWLSGIVSTTLPESSKSSKSVTRTGASYLILLTKAGLLKKTKLTSYASINARGLNAITLNDGDVLRWAKLCTDEDEIVVATAQGYVVTFPAAEVTTSSRTTKGNKCLKLKDGDTVAAMDVRRPDRQDQLVVVTRNGYGKRLDADDFANTKRNTQGLRSGRLKAKDEVSSLCSCTQDDEVMISTRNGVIIRQRVADITLRSRAAAGVLVQTLDGGANSPLDNTDAVRDVSVVPPDLLLHAD
mmetsp:Transcript_33469/g.106872  ORF Transcript_33469/g.106872 Transcript_33469/m.106872 type:complete len:921 (-) Transcript_33469:127-2889(-)